MLKALGCIQIGSAAHLALKHQSQSAPQSLTTRLAVGIAALAQATSENDSAGRAQPVIEAPAAIASIQVARRFLAMGVAHGAFLEPSTGNVLILAVLFGCRTDGIRRIGQTFVLPLDASCYHPSQNMRCFGFELGKQQWVVLFR